MREKNAHEERVQQLELRQQSLFDNYSERLKRAREARKRKPE